MDKVAPHPCLGCGKIGTVLCDNCKYNISHEPFSGCLMCAKVCLEATCPEHDVPICKAWIVGERRGDLLNAIDAYKFQNIKAAVRSLVDLLDERLPILPNDLIIVPVPTLSSHVRQRGYDHLDLLAKVLAHKRNLKVGRIVERSSGKTQHTLNRLQRQSEAQKTFSLAINTVISPSTPLLVLDDIITTGSTVKAITKLLSEAGAQNIFVASLAYQPID